VTERVSAGRFRHRIRTLASKKSPEFTRLVPSRLILGAQIRKLNQSRGNFVDDLYRYRTECTKFPGPRGYHGPASQGTVMSKAFIARVIQESTDVTGVVATRTTNELLAAIVKELKRNGKFTVPSFGTFTVRKTKARKALSPRTGEPIRVKAGKTVRFKASPVLKKLV
jgi:DNA-binding protein HU-beta